MAIFSAEAADAIVWGVFAIWGDDLFWCLMERYGPKFGIYLSKPEGMPRRLFRLLAGDKDVRQSATRDPVERESRQTAA